jgi:TonB family protein
VDSGPNLLLDWRQPGDSPRLLRAGMGSLLTHAALFVLIVFVTHLDAKRTLSGASNGSNTAKFTPLFDPPRALTQTAPNRGKISKELNVEDPRPRTFRAPKAVNPLPPQPAAPRLSEPPKIEASLNPPAAGLPAAPPPSAPPPPKLALETPAAPPPAQAKLAPPKSSVDEAIRAVARGAGQGSLVVGDIDPPTIPKTGSSLELLSDPMGVDFKPYLIRVLSMVRRNWFAVIPESAHLGRRGLVTLQFVIDRDGQVPKLVIASPSGAEALDRAAVAGVSASVPFPPLPKEFKGRDVRLQFSFKYNVP